MNILLVSYLFPPVANPQAILSGRTAKYLRKAGHHVTVLAATNTESFSSSHGIDESLNRDLEDVEVHYVADRLQKGRVANLFKKLIYPERYSYWVDKVLDEALPLYDATHFDIIYSLAYPMASNFAGLRLKQTTGIPWVAHFSDPGYLAYKLRFRSPIKTYLTRSLELHILRSADGITFVNQETLLRNTADTPVSRDKCIVVPHSFDPEYHAPEPGRSPNPNCLRFSYVGSLYGKRTPYNTMLALKRAIARIGAERNDVEFHLYGAIDKDIQFQLQKEWQLPWVKSFGPVNYASSVQAMRDSDYLILLDWSSEDNLYFPSKLIDYLAASRPVIGITPGNSYSARLLRDLEYPVIYPEDVTGLTEFFYKLLQHDRLEVSPQHQQMLEDFKAETVVKRLISFLESKVKFDVSSFHN